MHTVPYLFMLEFALPNQKWGASRLDTEGWPGELRVKGSRQFVNNANYFSQI
jgi:hypothetical protein